ncbi:hypothetical protein MASR2M17_19140 [Aminivibrio sp.]
MRHIALEGRCFVLSCNQFVTKDMYPEDLEGYSELKNQPDIMSRGGSAVIDPLGNYAAGPVWDKEEILLADLDMEQVIEARYDFDVMGHYSRPDVLSLLVNEEEKRGVEYSGETAPSTGNASATERNDGEEEPLRNIRKTHRQNGLPGRPMARLPPRSPGERGFRS